MAKPPLCPYFRKPCLEHGCTHYVQLHGRDPQTGERVDSWVCIDLAMLKVAMEGNTETRGAGAAIESFRNEMVRDNARTASIMMRQIPPDPRLVSEHAEPE